MRIIEVVADGGHESTVRGIAEQHSVADYWAGWTSEDGRRAMYLLVRPEKQQAVLDALQSALGKLEHTRILILPVEATLPRPAELEEDEAERYARTRRTREALYDEIQSGARLDSYFLLMVLFSTIVAAIGLLEDNVAVVIGAMVIAPLLGPNLALALATALGDRELMWQALRTNLAGLALAAGLAALIGMILPVNIGSAELAARTDVAMDSIALALASGAAAVLSLTTGLPTALVGVMVAVALLPPTATLGLMLGAGQTHLALGAGLLLAVNVVCVNLAAKLVFLYQGVRPRTWLEKRQARQSMVAYLLVWLVALTVLAGAIYVRQQLLAAG